ncbi:protein TonB [Dysgonomonas sp. PFB1-18]|uniref:energy transducer TonB n=1 Tax=unclassified Dysgonomonas TaxID=2630389 RepID=UPI00247321F1|nr:MULTISPECIES: energy transducer TonB [unclassified Dysgonomonas]MDH6311045.1 protein TonB [Dysgonomonas sp. PF1-14]MDH6337894.1 protein TonB [Dysgonomonas sp. PF1-16]MDH6382593.1 protein TonB [Dysgonomonas sp. PFB1-18]MDH6398026.1 protein TonB [Dysgonomonas sp. PF1-23]
MKRIFLILILLLSILSCFGQYGDQDEEMKVGLIKYERMPQYPGGETELYKFINKNFVYPQSAIDDGVEGMVRIRFLIREDGTPDSIFVVKGIHSECDSIALSIVKMIPKWEVGGNFSDKNSESEDIWFTLSIRFDQTNWIIRNEGICKTPDRMPSFPGGEEEMYKYFREKTKPKPPCPTCTMGYLPQGRVTVRFIVTRTGKIRDVKIIKGLDQASDKIAFRAVKDMPDWTPAQHNGKDVNTYYTLPVIFRLY